MNPIAQQALARARMPASAPARQTERPLRPSAAPTPTSFEPRSPSPTGPIDKYQLRQGKQYALDIVESCGAQLKNAWGIKDLLARLERSTGNKPPSFAMGVNSVADILRGHLAQMPAEKPEL
ncbi:hypothetical protein ACTUVN_003255 [Pseudomonas caspiana]